MHWPADGHQHVYTEYLIKWVKDFSRTIDYLETRPDIDCEKLAFLGLSWGGRLANVIPAVEKRLKASISVLGGLWVSHALPEADEFNYCPRVEVPTLMLNGKHDIVFAYETAVKPMFDFLGTPEADKRLVMFDTDHYIPTNGLIRESLDWLDRYLGPVE
jgi:dienelactone hydrolase